MIFMDSMSISRYFKKKHKEILDVYAGEKAEALKERIRKEYRIYSNFKRTGIERK